LFSTKYNEESCDIVDEDDKFLLSKPFPESEIHIHRGERCYHFKLVENEKSRESGAGVTLETKGVGAFGGEAMREPVKNSAKCSK
jgi:hypothetical protein